MNTQLKHKFEMKSISIEFPGVKALTDVNFEIDSGAIHALIGANGAGKSTLMKILGGVYDHYTGSIELNGNKIEIRSPRDAKKLGIEIVYQEVDTALIPYLSVAENIMLDVLVNEMGNKQFVNWKGIHAAARKTMARLDIKLDTHTLVQNLSLAEKQMVLIARALAGECGFLILDEPTAPLSQTETEELFRLMRDLAYNHGVGIIFISHRLPEIFEICELVTVMRDGQVVATQSIEASAKKQVIELMLGHRFDETYPKAKVDVGNILFEIKDVSEADGAVTDVNLSVRAGEIVGVTGLVGAGKTELCKTIFGALKISKGEIFLKGRKLNISTPHSAVRQGIALVPEERRKEGVLVEEPVYINLSMASLDNFSNPFGFLKQRAEHASARKIIDDLGVRTPSDYQKLAFLSGGNQQKVAVGKWLISNADIYIFDEPTKGVDVGAKHEIFELIGRLAQAGKGIIYASCEFPEILGITDRICVMYDHTIVKELKTTETSEEEILFFSTGGK
jgi:simple sugar transport system ATP-binding protein